MTGVGASLGGVGLLVRVNRTKFGESCRRLLSSLVARFSKGVVTADATRSVRCLGVDGLVVVVVNRRTGLMKDEMQDF